MDKMRLRIEEIAIKYADLVEKRIQEALDANMVGSAAMNEVNDGMCMLNSVTRTLIELRNCDIGQTPTGPIRIHEYDEALNSYVGSLQKDMDCFFNLFKQRSKKKNSGYDVEGPTYSGAYPASDDE